MKRVKDFLKGKSEEEIKDLEKRGFCRGEGSWKFKIQLKPYFDDYKVDKDLNKIKEGVIVTINEKMNDLKILVNSAEINQFNELFERFKESNDVDTFDKNLFDVYVWADKNNVWIGTC